MTIGSYVIMKLSTGEQLMALKTSEDDATVTLLYPITLKSYQRVNERGNLAETVAGAPFCHFAQDNIFKINKNYIVFENELHENLVKYYTNMVDEFVEQEEVSDDTPMASMEEIDNVLKKLDAIIKDGEKGLIEDDSDSVFYEGNDTLH